MPERDGGKFEALTAAPGSAAAAVRPRSRAGRRARQLGVPAGASVALHATLLLSTTLLVWGIAWHSSRSGPEVTVTFEEPRAGSGAPAATPASAPLPKPSEATSVPVAAVAPAPAPSEAPVLTSLAMGPADGASAPALAPATSTTAAAPLLVAPPTSGGDVRFAGLGASSARSVVYVIDGSGPMVSSLSAVMAEVQRSINRLSPSQRFGVVVFRQRQKAAPAEPGLTAPTATDEGTSEPAASDADGPRYEWFNPALVRATPEAKDRVAKWLAGIKPGGKSTPLDGLRAAIEMKPDAVFLLSRSIERSGGGVWDLGLQRTMAELDRLNPRDFKTARRPIVIKTIQFLDEDPTGIMQAIGKQHGGEKAAAGGQGGAGDGAAYIVIKRGADLASR